MKTLTKPLALFLTFIMIFAMLATCLVGCDRNDDTDTDTDSSTDTTTDTNNTTDTDSTKPDNTVEYRVQIKTVGGMALSDLTVFVNLDGARQDVDTTDKNGMVSFNLPRNSGYTVSVKTPPAGYNFEESYKLNETGTVITVMSSVIENPDGKLPDTTYKKGDIVKDFEITTVNGETLKLSELLKTKKMVMLNFFYTTCGPCANEAPYMQSAYEKYKDDIEIIAISPYPLDNEQLVKNFVYDYGITFPACKVSSSWANAFGVSGYPTNIVIDRYGMIAVFEVGGITSQTPFNIMFDYFTKDEYVQRIVNDIEEITPTEVPDIEMPSSDEIGAAINKGEINIEYFPEDNEMSWPFIIKEDENGEKYIFTSNSGKLNSFSQINMKVELKAGDVLTFDYIARTENTSSSADVLYVFADGKDIFQIVGVGDDWKTCYAYVADQDGEYEINLLYMKNEIADGDPKDDGISIKNMRITNKDDIDEPTYISKYAATQKNEDGFGFQKYVHVVLDDQGFYRVCQYHVDGHECDKNGPYLLAELIGVTQFQPDTSITILMYNGVLADQEDTDNLLKYCNYASNSKYYGLTAVTEELKELLIKVTDAIGVDESPDEWLQMCEYYSAYGTEKQLENPINGLSVKSAYTATEGSENPNTVEYDGRLIMPRGLLYKFVPTKSGAYRITTNSSKEVQGWIFLDGKETLYTDSDQGERLSYLYTGNDHKNCTMVAYMEEGKEYYIDIAYYEIYDAGTFTFTVEYIGESFEYFIVASPGPFTFEEGENFNPDTLEGMGQTIAGGVDVMLGEDGYYYVKNKDGSKGSILYADFLFPTNIFPTQNLQDVIKAGGFDLSKSETDQEALAYISSFEVQYIIDQLREVLDANKFTELNEDNLLINIINGKKDTDDTELKNMIEQYRSEFQADKKTLALDYFKALWGEDYEQNAEIYQIEEVLDGKLHGIEMDYTELAEKYIAKMITAETHPDNPELYGCVVVDEELAMILQAIMDKFTFAGVDHSWTKLCYYYEHIGA
ncbi:MAG: TlpA family protein disulfide reductase [Clostridia bacterium]|nr:TlpA family protein disulfide reductase [Clostridia bacterium]